MSYQLMHGDCLELLKTLPDNSVDGVVTDPPYGLSFMGKKWDYDVPEVAVWAERMRVLKPGGHLLAFAGTRTQHRMCVRIEDAGFEIRDMIAWVYGSGFPKSLDVSKAIDKAARATARIKPVIMAGLAIGSTTFHSVSDLVAPRASEPSRSARGIRARPSSVATITTGTARIAKVSEAHSRPGVPKVGAGSASGKNRRSSEPPST